MIDLDKLRAGKMDEYPFRIARFEDLIPPGDMMRLYATYPKDNFRYFSRKMGSDKTFRLCGRPLIVAGEPKPAFPENLSAEWLALAALLLSDEYKGAMSDLTGLDLSKCIVGADFWRFNPGCFLSPHADVPCKTLTHLFYFVKSWERSWGGLLGLHDYKKEDDLIREVVPSMSVSSVFIKSDVSFHSISEVRPEAKESRKVLDIVFYNTLPPPPKPGRLTGPVVDALTLID